MIVQARFDLKVMGAPVSIQAERIHDHGWSIATVAGGEEILWELCTKPDCECVGMCVLEGSPHLASILNKMYILKKRPS